MESEKTRRKTPKAPRGGRGSNEGAFGSALEGRGGKRTNTKIRVAPGTIGPMLKQKFASEETAVDLSAELWDGERDRSAELEIMEEATRLVKEAKRN